MRLTHKSDYAMKAVLDLAVHYGNGPVQIHDMAKSLDAPKKFLEQVLLELKRGGFVRSLRGKDGGYLLAKAPAHIRVGDVVRFVDGPTEPIACLAEGYSRCDDLYRCLFRKIWQRVADATNEIVDNVTFESLAQQVHRKNDVLEYVI